MNLTQKITQMTPKGSNLSATDLVEVSTLEAGSYVTKSITGQEIIDAAAGSGVTDVTATAPLASTGGSTPDISISPASGSGDGYLKSVDFTTFNNKQDALVSGTNIKTIEGQSLLGSGNINLTATDVGLGNVDNTSDLNKPVSTATQTALNAKQDALTLTTTGTSGAATLVGSTLNIPQYSGGGGGASGIHALLKLTTGQQTSAAITATTINSTALIANRLLSLPFIPAQTFTCSNLYINAGTAVAGGLGRILIYSDVNGIPTTKLYESANLDLSTSGIKTATTSFTFNQGDVYWLTIHSNSTNSVSALGVGSLMFIRTNGVSQVSGYSGSATFGSAPTTYPSLIFLTSTVPAVFITAA